MSVGDDDATALIRRARILSGDACPPMLVELNGMVTLTRCALHRFSHDLDVAAMGLVGPTVVDAMLAQYFAAVHRPPYPTRYFEDTERALMWLIGNPAVP